MKTPLPNEDIEREIDKQLQELRLLPLSQSGKENAAKIAGHIARIHSYDQTQSTLPLLGAEWLVHLVRSSDTCPRKTEIIAAIEYLSGAEYYRGYRDQDPSIKQKDRHFISWSIGEADWQRGYGAGQIGSSLWDMAAIITRANDPSFTDAFLDGYIRHGGAAPTYLALYVNLYYVCVAQAVRDNDYGSAIEMTGHMVGERSSLRHEALESETLSRLHLAAW